MSNPSESGRGPDQLTRRGHFEDPIGEECLPGDSNNVRSDWYSLKGQELVANPHQWMRVADYIGHLTGRKQAMSRANAIRKNNIKALNLVLKRAGTPGWAFQSKAMKIDLGVYAVYVRYTDAI